MPRRDWTRGELTLAFHLYCRTPFGKIHMRNPDVIALARVIGRTSSAVSWKLANFARLDPYLKKRAILGARHGAEAEKEIWNEFDGNWEKLAQESERLLRGIVPSAAGILAEDAIFPDGKEREATVRVRVNQSFFRSAVLAAYDCRCCVTGLSLPELLIASHIAPWSTDEKNRTNPRNGLCLNALHDRAFDCGLMTVTPDYVVHISKQLKTRPQAASTLLIQKYDGIRIHLPDRFLPDPQLLSLHNRHVFRDARD